MEEHNQISNINITRIRDRCETEFIGLCKGIISSGDISTGNAEFMLSWLIANPVISENWMGTDLYTKLLNYLSDGVIDDSEESELLKLLTEITGSPKVNLSGQNATTTLPLCKNPPNAIIIDGHDFVLTGHFEYGKRKDVNSYIEDRGGSVKKTPSGNTDYIVLAETGSAAWIQSTNGRKIQKAVDLRDANEKIRIISEEHFFKSTESVKLVEILEKLTNEEIFQQLIDALQENESVIDSLEKAGLFFHLEPIYLAAYETFKNGKPKKSPSCELFFSDENDSSMWVVQNRYQIQSFNHPDNALYYFIESIS